MSKGRQAKLCASVEPGCGETTALRLKASEGAPVSVISGAPRALPLTAAAQGQMGSELSNSSKSGHTRTRSQSDFAACSASGDARVAQEAMSRQMMRQSCQDDGNSPGSPDNLGRSWRT